jgi:hypothetical protein
MFCRLRAWPCALGFLTFLLVAPARAGAQAQEPDPWEQARWRFGPFAVTPRVELKSLGWDTNVYNSPNDPKADFTTTVGAPVDWWFRAGRARLHVVDYFEGVYYATYSNQGGFNQRHELTFMVPLNRLRPYVGGYYLSTNDRPGFGIDARIRHTESNANAGAVVRLTARTNVDISYRQTTFRYQDEDYPGEPFSTTLDGTTQNFGAQASYRLTPLTTLTLLGDGVRERHTQSSDRDNDGFRILPGVEFDPDALIKGKAQVGYRKLNTLTPGMPDFSGLIANVELAYVLRGMTRLAVGLSRDIYFSFEVVEPFYIQPGLTLNVTQQVRGPWDVQARAGWYRLDYQRVTSAESAPIPDRIDRYTTWGGGVGYRVGKDIRVGVNLDYSRRESIVDIQEYEGFRGGMAVTYVLR